MLFFVRLVSSGEESKKKILSTFRKETYLQISLATASILLSWSS